MKCKKKKGFTLVELVAGMSTFILVMVALTSLLTTIIRSNSANRITFESNTNSKAFFEAVKEKRPEVFANPATLDGEYAIRFNDKVYIKDYVRDELLNDETPPAKITTGEASNFSTVKGAGNERYCMGIKVEWDTVNKVYNIEAWSWDRNKGESSLVNRKTMLAQQ